MLSQNECEVSGSSEWPQQRRESLGVAFGAADPVLHRLRRPILNLSATDSTAAHSDPCSKRISATIRSALSFDSAGYPFDVTCRIMWWITSLNGTLGDMHSDGRVLPDLKEAVVLRSVGLLRTDDLPDLAARWLATDLVDTDSIRILAGHNPTDPWGIDALLDASIEESNIDIPNDNVARQDVIVDWVTSIWRQDHDTRKAVRTLAYVGETQPDFDLGLFVGFNDEWNGGWGRLDNDLKAAAELEINYFLHGTP